VSLRISRRDLGAVAAITIAALLVAAPFLRSGGWYMSHEEFRYLARADYFADAIRHGVWHPCFVPDLYGGFGYPLFCFYQPGFFYWLLPFTALPMAAHQAIYAALVALLLAGGLGAYLLVREQTDRLWGLFGAVWFLLTPYLCVNLYVRGDLSELAGMLAVPWCLFALLRLGRRVEAGESATAATLGCAAAMLVLIVSHPAPALVAIPGLCVFAAVQGWGSMHRSAHYLRFGIALVLALALSSPYWLTVAQLRPHVGFHRLVEGYFRPELHGVHVHQLLSRRWALGGSIPNSAEDRMSFQLGVPHLLLAILGAWFGRRSRLVIVAFAGYVLLIFLVLDVSQVFWEHAGFIRFLQFPWRLLSVTATLQLVAASGLYTVVTAPGRRWPTWAQAGALATTITLTAAYHSNQFTIDKAVDPAQAKVYYDAARGQRLIVLGMMEEYLPRTVRVPPRAPRMPSQPVVRVEGPGQVHRLDPENPYRLRYDVETSAPATAVIEQIYLPVWRVLVDDVDVARHELEEHLTDEGFLRIRLPAARRYRIEAYYDGPPWRRLRNAAILIIAACCLLVLALPRSRGHPRAGGRPATSAERVAVRRAGRHILVATDEP
jgi:hypothetical protein